MAVMGEPTTTEATGNEQVFPWSEIQDIENRSAFVVRARMFRLLNAADESRKPWRAEACREAALRCHDVLLRRGKAADLEAMGE